MKKYFVILFCVYLNQSFSQRLDMGMEFIIPFASSSIISTKYEYLTDDPVSFNFAKIKNKTQYFPQFNVGFNINTELSYRMFSIKLLFYPLLMTNRTFSVFYPDFQLGETKYTGTITQTGIQLQPLLKYSFKTFGNHKVSLMAGGFYFRQYKGIPEEDESLVFGSPINPGDIYKYLLWDSNLYLYGYSFGVEHNFLGKNRQNRKHSIIVSNVNTPIGYKGFNQMFIQYQISIFNLKLYSTLKRNKIYLEN